MARQARGGRQFEIERLRVYGDTDPVRVGAPALQSDAETQRLESIYQQTLAALEELKKPLLHQAFSGAL